MITIIVVEKTGSLKEVLIKENFDLDDLYKKCNFRKPKDFNKRTTWKNIKLNDINIEINVFARNNGAANTENKYDMPPPIDKDLYFGNVAIVAIDTDINETTSLTIKSWKKVYEHLFGGFENLDDADDEDEEDELDNVPIDLKTKDGYLKDDFIVDNNENELVSDSISTSETEAETEEETEEETPINNLDSSITSPSQIESDSESNVDDSELEYEEYENLNS